MSIFIALESLQQTATNRVETPRFLLDENEKEIKQLTVCIENVSKPDTLACLNQGQEADWVLSKRVYSLEIDNGEVVEYRTAGHDPNEEPRALSSSKFSQVFHRTPIAMLYSASKTEQEGRRVQRYKQLPLYSDSCKIKIQIFEIENTRDKFLLETSPIPLVPAAKIQLKRSQLLAMVHQLRQQAQTSRLRPSRVLRQPSQSIHKHSTHTITMDRLPTGQQSMSMSRSMAMGMNGGESRSSEVAALLADRKCDCYRLRVDYPMKINKKYHQIELAFVIAVEKLQECAGYMRAGFLKTNQRVNSRRSESYGPSKDSQYTTDEVKVRDFNYQLDFSGKNEGRSTLKIQKKKLIPRRQAVKKKFNLFSCCTSAANVDDSSQVVVDPEDRKERAIPFYLGRCKGKNLFSVMDPKKGKGEAYSLFQPHYY